MRTQLSRNHPSTILVEGRSGGKFLHLEHQKITGSHILTEPWSRDLGLWYPGTSPSQSPHTFPLEKCPANLPATGAAWCSSWNAKTNKGTAPAFTTWSRSAGQRFSPHPPDSDYNDPERREKRRKKTWKSSDEKWILSANLWGQIWFTPIDYLLGWQ